MRHRKKLIISAGLAILLFIMDLCSFGNCFISEAKAVTFDELNAPGMFLKQKNGDKQCTLVAATMLIRRAAMISGSANWSDITVDKVKANAWIDGQGIRHTFTYAGITVNKASFQGNPVKESILLLASHPEGIVLYDQIRSPRSHAILLTDYTDQLFYGADPSEYEEVGRVLNTSTSLLVKDAEYYWYVSSISPSSIPGQNTSLPVSDISTCPVVLSETKFIYDGSEKKPMVTISGLTENVDYTVTYANNVMTGTATVYISGIGAYKGMASVNFKIVDASSINAADTSISDKDISEKNAVDQNTADKNAADKNAADKSAVGLNTADKNVTDKSVVDQNTADKNAKDQNAVDKNTTDKNAANKNAADQKNSDKNVSDKNVGSKLEDNKNGNDMAANNKNNNVISSDSNANDKNDLNKVIVIISNQKIKKGNTAAIKYALPNSMKVVKENSGKSLNAGNEVKISYTSSNTKVAKVNSKGIITGIGKGSADITVTMALSDGSSGVYVFSVDIDS
jgi:AAA ATPase containing von Willebrand factor type A (vWA) domain